MPNSNVVTVGRFKINYETWQYDFLLYVKIGFYTGKEISGAAPSS